MKRLPSITILLAAAVFAPLASGAETALQHLLTQAQTEMLKGDLAGAKRDFLTAQQLDPKNPTVIGFLRQLAATDDKSALAGSQEKQLSALMVPKVEFKEATLDSALDFLKRQAAKLSGDKIAVNFVPQLSDDQLHTQTVTLSLTNVPFTEVMRYLGAVGNVRFVFEKYAILVKPAASGATADAATK
jgi:hypothetical protein